MNGMVDFLLRTYGHEEIEETMDLRREFFWSGIRASLYKKVHAEKNSYYQWAYITGKKSRYKNGSRITLSEKNLKHFWQTIEYLNTEEGLEWMRGYGIYETPPEHPDDLISIIQEAMTDRKIKKEIFRLFMKNREKILNFLSG